MTKVRRSKPRGRVRVGKVSLYQHHGAWWTYYREGGIGRRKRIGPDRDVADRIAAELNAQLATETPSLFSYTPVSLPELAKRWLDHHEYSRNSSLATVRRYRAAVQHALDFASAVGGPRYAHEFAVDSFMRHLRSTRVSPNGHPNTSQRFLRQNGVRFIVEACRSMFNFSASRRLVPPYFKNPFSTIASEVSRNLDAKSVHVFSKEQTVRILEACDDWQFVVFFTLATTGLRPGELIHLLVEDLDIEKGVLRIRNRPALGWHVKTRCERLVPVFEELVGILRRMLNGRRAGVLFRRRHFWAGNDPVLNELTGIHLEAVVQKKVSALGSHPTRWEVQKAARSAWNDAGVIRDTRVRSEFIKVAVRIGLDGVTTPKSWRHTFATLMQDANVDPLVRQQVLGHAPQTGCPGAGLGMTAVYTHTQPETYRRQVRSALELIPKVLALANRRLVGAEEIDTAIDAGEAR